MREISDISDPRLVKALAHPLRVRILSIMESRAASPVELSEALSAPLGNVSYHVRILQEYGLIRLVRKTPRRGAIEHHYEAIGRLRISDDAWGETPDIVKEALVGAILKQVSDYVNAAAATGGFDRPDAHVTRTPLVLDARGFEQLSKALLKLADEARRIEEQSVERLNRADHDGELQVGLVQMLFEGADFGVKTPSRSAARDGRTRRTVATR